MRNGGESHRQRADLDPVSLPRRLCQSNERPNSLVRARSTTSQGSRWLPCLRAALAWRTMLLDRRGFQIQRDLAPEEAVNIDLIGHDECDSEEKPHEADPEAVGPGCRVEDSETVCRV